MLDGLVLDHKARFQFSSENRAKDRVHTDTWRMGSDDEVGNHWREPTK